VRRFLDHKETLRLKDTNYGLYTCTNVPTLSTLIGFAVAHGPDDVHGPLAEGPKRIIAPAGNG
jgi:hypothetical protein